MPDKMSLISCEQSKTLAPSHLCVRPSASSPSSPSSLSASGSPCAVFLTRHPRLSSPSSLSASGSQCAVFLTRHPRLSSPSRLSRASSVQLTCASPHPGSEQQFIDNVGSKPRLRQKTLKTWRNLIKKPRLRQKNTKNLAQSHSFYNFAPKIRRL